jgi:hypothetical protein
LRVCRGRLRHAGRIPFYGGNSGDNG